MQSLEGETLLKDQVEIWQLMLGFAESMALKCAVELVIADTINSLGGPVTLSQIASGIDSPCVDIPYLARIVRFLVRKQVFSEHSPSDGGDPLFGLTDNSKWLFRDSEVSLAPMVLMENNPWQLALWHHLSQYVKEGGMAFKNVDFASQNPEFNRVFNDVLACTAKIIMRAVLSYDKDPFDGVETLLDVGGGTGGNLAEIVQAYPHIKA